MKIESLEEQYPKLKSEFPDDFIYFFGTDGKLNRWGSMAQELYDLRRKPERWTLPSIRPESPLDCVATDHCKADLRR